MKAQVKDDTLYGLLLSTCLRYRDSKKIAIRKRHKGKWRRYTWQDYHSSVLWVGSALLELGLEHGDKVSIIGDFEPEWVLAQMGTLALGAVVSGYYVDLSPRELRYFLNHSEAKYVFAQDQEQVDKVLSIAGEVPTLKKVIYWDPKGLWSYTETLLMGWEELISLGQKAQKEKPDIFPKAAERVKEDDLALLLYTSGGSGAPKGVMHSHGTCISAARVAQSFYQAQPDWNDVPHVSPDRFAGQVFLFLHLTGGYTLNFPESQETVPADIREVAPDLIFYPSSLWEAIISGINNGINDSARLNRSIYRSALKAGYKIADCHFKGVKPDASLRLAYALYHALIFQPIKDGLGLVRAKAVVADGGSLGADSFRFLRALGLNLRQAYGIPEVNLIAGHRDTDVKFESVGRKLCDELAVTEEGEIIVRDKSMFVGYYKDPQAYQKAVRAGWFHTGDAGYIDKDGHLIYKGKLADSKQPRSGT